MRGHLFQKIDTDQVQIDNGVFTRSEAAEIFSLLRSKNLLSQTNANLAILERNGTLLWVMVTVAVLLLSLVIIRIRR